MHYLIKLLLCVFKHTSFQCMGFQAIEKSPISVLCLFYKHCTSPNSASMATTLVVVRYFIIFNCVIEV